MKQIWTYDGPVEEAFCPQSVTLVLEHDIDISRGSMLIGTRPSAGREHRAAGAKSAGCTRARCSAGKKYFLKHTTHTVQVVVTEIVNKLNMVDARNRSRARRNSR